MTVTKFFVRKLLTLKGRIAKSVIAVSPRLLSRWDIWKWINDVIIPEWTENSLSKLTKDVITTYCDSFLINIQGDTESWYTPLFLFVSLYANSKRQEALITWNFNESNYLIIYDNEILFVEILNFNNFSFARSMEISIITSFIVCNFYNKFFLSQRGLFISLMQIWLFIH